VVERDGEGSVGVKAGRDKIQTILGWNGRGNGEERSLMIVDVRIVVAVVVQGPVFHERVKVIKVTDKACFLEHFVHLGAGGLHVFPRLVGRAIPLRFLN
jgi:hypothetical protein